jgi:hypothetical protein
MLKQKRNRYFFEVSLGVFGALFPVLAHALGTLNCASCEVLAAQRLMDSRENVLTPTAHENVDLGWNVASLMSGQAGRPVGISKAATGKVGMLGGSLASLESKTASPIQFWQPMSRPQLPPGAQGWWDGQGELPGGFQRPWEFPKTSFDPAFMTSYYTTEKGPILQGQGAPWGISPFVFTSSPNWWIPSTLQDPQWF